MRRTPPVFLDLWYIHTLSFLLLRDHDTRSPILVVIHVPSLMTKSLRINNNDTCKLVCRELWVLRRARRWHHADGQSCERLCPGHDKKLCHAQLLVFHDGSQVAFLDAGDSLGGSKRDQVYNVSRQCSDRKSIEKLFVLIKINMKLRLCVQRRLRSYSYTLRGRIVSRAYIRSSCSPRR